MPWQPFCRLARSIVLRRELDQGDRRIAVARAETPWRPTLATGTVRRPIGRDTLGRQQGMEKSFEEKVEELWNREQIKSLTYAYGECILRRDAEGMAKLFTNDGSVDFSYLGWGIHTGHEAIKKHYAGTWSYRVKPFFTNHYIEFIDKIHARGWCWLDNRGVRNGESLISCDRIYDEYQIVDGNWLFSSRRIVQFFLVPLSKGWGKELEEFTEVEPRWH
jgi:hypothetical protein